MSTSTEQPTESLIDGLTQEMFNSLTCIHRYRLILRRLARRRLYLITYWSFLIQLINDRMPSLEPNIEDLERFEQDQDFFGLTERDLIIKMDRLLRDIDEIQYHINYDRHIIRIVERERRVTFVSN